MLKKILAWLLVISTTATIAIGGTLAYLTDRDSEANVFTVGNVEIDLKEDFEQGSTLIPGVDIKKEATITNTGINDAWVWLTVLLPYEMGPHTPEESMSASTNVVHWNYPKESASNIIVDFNSTPVEIDTDGDGVTEKYYQTSLLWNEILEVGDTTGIMLSKVYMDTHVDIDPDGNMHWVDGGQTIDLNWNVNEKGNPVIHVGAYAIQTEGFADVQAAYAAYNTQWGPNGYEFAAPNAAPPVEVPDDATSITNLDDLKAAMTDGGNYVIEAPITVNENLTFTADTALYCTDANNVLSFENNSKVTVNANTALALYGVQMDGKGTYSFDENGHIVYDADARRTTPLLNAGAGSTLTLGTQTKIENVVAKGSAVVSVSGTADNRAKVVLEHATIANCAGEAGTIINVAQAGDVVIEEGTVISNNASYNNNNHGIIRVYNAWDAANPSTVTMNGGEITNNYFSGNGMIGLYYGKLIMNGGKINNNSWFEDNQKNNGWYPIVYAHSNSSFVMNDGEITGNSVKTGVINSLNSNVVGALTINGGEITNNIATNTGKDALAAVSSLKEQYLKIEDAANVSGTVYYYYAYEEHPERTYLTLEDYLAIFK